jgi:4-hydroxy-tetrahydrodipicolinate synthase
LGTTAETPTLSYKERKQILGTIIESVHDRVPVVVGIGCNNPLDVNMQIHLFDLRKVSAILSVAPYYNRPQQQGLIGHYKLIAEQSPLPVILYNVPTRTGVNIEAATTLQIAKKIPKVIGIKEASGNFAQIMTIINNRPKDFLVISGDDAITLPLLACGVDGVISVVANAFPKDFSTMVRLALNGSFNQAKEYHYKLLNCMSACFQDGSPGGVKAFLQVQGLIDDYVRLPLCSVQEETKQLIRDLFKTYTDGI